VGALTNLWSFVSGSIRDEALLHTPGSGRDPVRHGDLLAAAERTAGQVVELLGGRTPRRVALLLNNGEPWLRGLLATWRLGATAVPLPLPVAFAGPAAYLELLHRIARDAELDAVLIGGDVARVIKRLPDPVGGTPLIDVTEPVSTARPSLPGKAQELAVIQYTSGSTSRPKGVMLTHDNVASGLTSMRQAVRWTADDVAGMWLPLFHDMGLFSLLMSITTGATTWLWQPQDFVRRPMKWLAEFASTGATGVPAANFFYDMLVNAADRDGIPEDLDLSRWRLGTNGAEPVQRRSIEEFEAMFAPYGLRRGVVQPTYGMAEATLIVTFAHPLRPVRSLTVDRDRLARGDKVQRCEPDERARTVVSCGSPVAGMAVRIGDENGVPVPDGVVGEVQINGPAVTRGYLNLPVHQQPFTGDGWLSTGDLGFVHDGELYVTGRLKDMIIVHGHNYYAEDVEDIVRSTAGVRRRRCVAFAAEVDGVERMVVLWETRLEADGAADLTEVIRRRLAERIGLDVVLPLPVPVSTIPCTSSGKVKRHAAVAQWQENKLGRAQLAAAVKEGT
jgi:fatty-acyl-CoA synthase